jgi:hypothetical protein
MSSLINLTLNDLTIVAALKNIFLNKSLYFLLFGFWIFYSLIAVLSSLQPIYSLEKALLYSFLYCGLVIVIIGLFIFFSNHSKKDSLFLSEISFSDITLAGFAVLSYLGLILHLYDKLVIRNYSYDLCDGLREQWLHDGEMRSTISSLPSAFGHLFVYAGIFNFCYTYSLSKIPRRAKIISIFSILPIVIYAFSLNSKSVLLYLCAFCAVYSVLTGKKFRVFFPFIAIFLSFSIFFLSERIYCYRNTNTENYINGNLKDHGLTLPEAQGHHPVITMFKLYMLNGTFNFANSFELNDSTKRTPGILFDFSCSYLNKIFGNVCTPSAMIKTNQGVLSYFGHLYWAFGLFGIIIFAILNAALLLSVQFFRKNSPFLGLVAVIFVHVYIMNFLGWIIYTPKIMPFPYFVFYSIVFGIFYFFKVKKFR